MIRFTDHYVGVDVGVTTHPTAITVLRRGPGDHPVLEIVDMARAAGVPFARVAGEVERLLGALGGTVTLGVDATGPGAGLVQVLRARNVRCVAMTMGGAGRVRVHGDRWAVPSAAIYEVVYRLLTERRLLLNPAHPLARQLAREMDACTMAYTSTGNVRYEVMAQGSHGDLLVSTGLAAVLHEHPHSFMVHARERRDRPGHRERHVGTPRQGSAARQVIKQRLEDSRRESERTMWAQVGREDDPYP